MVDANFVKEIKFYTWVESPVLVKTSTGKWRMCNDFKDLNKVCPKDSYIFSHIDELVGATYSHELLNFMDDYSCYNQMKFVEKDASHTTFYVDNDIYHYTVIPIGLINASVTYQRMVNKLLTNMTEDTTEAYLNNIPMNSKIGIDHNGTLE